MEKPECLMYVQVQAVTSSLNFLGVDADDQKELRWLYKMAASNKQKLVGDSCMRLCFSIAPRARWFGQNERFLSSFNLREIYLYVRIHDVHFYVARFAKRDFLFHREAAFCNGV
jgi:hypothetical protein